METHTAFRVDNGHRGSKKRVRDIRDRELSEDTDCNPDLQASLRHPNIALSEPSCPYDAGEVSRRSDRQTNALPPPETPTLRSRLRLNRDNSSHRRRQANRSGNGADSDSDSNDDSKRPRYLGDNETTSIRKQKRPIKSSHEDTGPANQSTITDDGEDELKYKYVRQTLNYLADKIAEYVPIGQQIVREIELADNLYSLERPPLERSRINKRVPYKRDTNHKYVHVSDPIPTFIKALLQLLLYDSDHVIFRVRLKEGKPVYAEPVENELLTLWGWNFPISSDLTRRFGERLWGYRRGSTPLTERNIYRVDTHGEILGICTPEEDDEISDKIVRFCDIAHEATS